MNSTQTTSSQDRRHRRLWLSIAIALVSLTPVGCGGSGHPMAGVHGRVTYQGKPVPKGTITFQASSPDRRNATGMIDPDGNYTLQTETAGDGVELGGYYVTISARDDVVLDYIPKTPVPPKFLIPKKYEDRETSALMRTVARGGSRMDFELTD